MMEQGVPQVCPQKVGGKSWKVPEAKLCGGWGVEGGAGRYVLTQASEAGI